MKRTRIKICGIRTIESALAAAAAGADAIGLVFVEKSVRYIDLETAAAIIQALPAFVQPIGLFADAPAQQIKDIAAKLNLGTIQMHGSETPQDVAAVSPLRVIKALPFDQQLDNQTLHDWRSQIANISAVLVDSPPPADAQVTGGHGESFDWHAMAKSTSKQRTAGLAPIILAGGLTPSNITQAICTVEPYAVDVSSGVESGRGVKDLNKIKLFCDAVRKADASCAKRSAH